MNNNKTVRLTFESVGAPDEWVEVADLGWWSERKLASYSKKGGENAFLADAVQGWSFTCAETGEPLPLPQEDKEVLKRVPLRLLKALGEQLEALIGVPPTKRSSS